jgi:N-acetylmuramoyl-L-alanine amidase
MRRFALLGALAALLLPASAWGAGSVSLAVEPAVTPYGGVAQFRGAAEPLVDVFLVQQLPAGWTVVAHKKAEPDGTFAFQLRARKPSVFQARTLTGSSPAVATRIRPLLQTRLRGSVIGGRLLPADAGKLVFRADGRSRRIRVGPAGRFRVRVGELQAGRHVLRVALRPAPGWTRVGRRFLVRVRRPELRLGSHGPNVLALKRRLSTLGYALPSVDAGYGYATYEAVLAFQKVHWLPRTGTVDRRFWRVLASASVPRARVRRGNYLEIDKSRQVLLEVRGGKVARVIHVSTGATGNTPVGTWRVYREVFGWDWILYHPMYFLRGFAIHGYPEVPPWPASHGCVRVPLWLAAGLRERWGYGSVVRVYP